MVFKYGASFPVTLYWMFVYFDSWQISTKEPSLKEVMNELAEVKKQNTKILGKLFDQITM